MIRVTHTIKGQTREHTTSEPKAPDSCCRSNTIKQSTAMSEQFQILIENRISRRKFNTSNTPMYDHH